MYIAMNEEQVWILLQKQGLGVTADTESDMYSEHGECRFSIEEILVCPNALV